MNKKVSPSLFGVAASNREFSKKEAWGKNQFNTSFPVSLACHMDCDGLKVVYITLNEALEVAHGLLKISDVLGLKPTSPNLYFAFEECFSPYEDLLTGVLPRIDLVTVDTSNDVYKHLKGIEIKLTALPDHQTCELSEDQFSCEIVVRPDTIVYLALNIAAAYQSNRLALRSFLEPVCGRSINWKNASDVIPALPQLIDCLDEVLLASISRQGPFLMQPIWKTAGKSLRLAEHCFDIFVWSDYAFTRLFIDVAWQSGRTTSITRHMRTVIWLAKMLYEFAVRGRMDHRRIIDSLTYDTKNDKAFSCGGQITYPYLKSKELTKPRVGKSAIKNIIIGGGEKFLSPERRLDGAILSDPDLF